ncbi:E3 ubiquitin-protein ligase ATL4 [Hondaea fermentalgiana]|uniref:E3 ubiquitin-protein ligase ATL4 n=1 Tax=Hondaea fermentalgiana TaxID=2315210 RepID=A0A2R5H0G9_9STRA|nr:E3 ubiquitin-protein ligase ATL4 [Hondaea fermentalgiana]|eukprot:GBG34553.1 E3 ubiquitin-protein ligase ATL4 [Hondaea fermentalgiana]
MRATGSRLRVALARKICCVTIFIVVVLLLGLGLSVTVVHQESGAWQKMNFMPGSLISSAAIYCEGMDQVVVVGGAALSVHTGRFHATSTVWVMGGDNNWHALSPVSGGLSARLGHTLNIVEDSEEYCDFLVYGSHDEDETQIAVLGRLSRENGESGSLQVAWGDDSALVVNTEANGSGDEDDFSDAAGPGLRERHTAVTFRDDIYFLGGFTRSLIDDNVLWKLSLSKDSTSSDASNAALPATRQATWSVAWSEDAENATKGPRRTWDLSSVVVGGDRLAFVGGEMWDAAQEPITSGDIWIWSTVKQSWEPSQFDRASTSFARSSAVVVALNDDLFVHGGTQIVSYRRQKVDLHKSSLLQTQPLAEEPLGRCASDGLADAGFFYCEPAEETLGGYRPECRSRHTGVLRKNSLLVFGGLSGQECLGVSYVFSDMWQLDLKGVLSGNLVPAQDSIADSSFAYLSSMYFFLALVFVTVLLFGSIIFRRRQLTTFTYAATDNGSRNRGASVSLIRNLPVIRFMDTGRDEDEVCPICLADYEPEDELLQLPCGHMFHPECGETWLVKNDSCPLCKRALGARDISETPSNANGGSGGAASGNVVDENDGEDSAAQARGRHDDGADPGIELQDLRADDATSPFPRSDSPSDVAQTGSDAIRRACGIGHQRDRLDLMAVLMDPGSDVVIGRSVAKVGQSVSIEISRMANSIPHGRVNYSIQNGQRRQILGI